MRITVLVLIALLAACSSSTKPMAPGTGEPAVVLPVGEREPLVALGWERGHPERKQWSSLVYSLIHDELFDYYDGAQDAVRFCPAYRGLSREQKATMWSELISAVSYFESGWSPVSRMEETSMGTDPVTGLRVYSEGLLQLSYQDVQWAPYCRFDWNRDKNLDPADPAKTILDPARNLDCGIHILAAQVRNRNNIILSSGVYWAVLKEGGRYNKIAQITEITRRLPFCTN